MRLYRVKASSLDATYEAGQFLAGSPDDAIRQARERYRNSPLGRALQDVRGFRFWIATDEKQEE